MGTYSLGDAMKDFIKKRNLNKNLLPFRIKEVWQDLMGTTVAKYTDEISVHHSTLIISTSVAPLKNELHFQKDTIIKRVNEMLGEQLIDRVVIK